MAERQLVWVICGGPSTEYEVSLSSAQVVCKHLNLSRRVARVVVITREALWLVSERELREEEDGAWVADWVRQPHVNSQSYNAGEAAARMIADEVDCAVIAIHGHYGEDGGLQGLFQSADIAYTGSGVLASALAFSKSTTISLYRQIGLATAASETVDRQSGAWRNRQTLSFPVFVKPAEGGSSVGMSLVRNAGELQPAVEKALEVCPRALIEERVDGVEVSCGVIDMVVDGQLEHMALPPTEIRPLTAEFFDYEAKYVAGKSKEVTPADLPKEIIAKIQRSALAAHQVLGCEGMSRTDMIVPRLGGDMPVLLETNTIPGMTETSLLPQQLRAQGITFSQFLDQLIEHALWRQQMRDAMALARS